MRVARNKFLVEVSGQYVRSGIKGIEFIDTDFNPKSLTTMIGRIKCLPISVGQEFKYDVKLVEGDEVVFNHLVCLNKNKFSDTLYFCNYHFIYAVIRDSRLIPLEDILFCEKIVDVGLDLGGFKMPDKVSIKIAKVFEFSKYGGEEGIKKGDIVFFTKDADYPMIISGKEFYRMYVRNIIGIERDGVLTTFRNKLLVKDVTELGKIGGWEKIYANTSLRDGIVLENGTTNIPKGTKLSYFNNTASIVNYKEQDYAFINEENVKYIQ